jgi:hypothetical protein
MTRADRISGESGTASEGRPGVFGRRWVGSMAVVACVAGLAAGCSSGSSSSTTSTTTATSTTASGLSAAAIRLLQRQLILVGCYTGSIDGIAGSATTAAIRSFQAHEGLSVDGVYGARTQAKLVSAAAAGKKICVATTTTTSTTTPSSTTTTAASGSTVPAAATAAINSYEATNGPAAGSFVITAQKRSTVDPSYVYFSIGPAAGHTVQGGYGFVHGSGSSWTVIGFGSAGVGCQAGSNTPAVPMSVLAGFGLTCPTS